MKHDYIDIYSKLGSPIWWDDHGVPRYCPFNVNLHGDITKDYCALAIGVCQGCDQYFRVCTHKRVFSDDDTDSRIALYYGDPPFHRDSEGEPCCGVTSSMLLLFILEVFQTPIDLLEHYHAYKTFWIRDSDNEGIHQDVVEFSLQKQAENALKQFPCLQNKDFAL